MTDTELMPKLVVGEYRTGGGKLKRGKGVFETELGAGAEPRTCLASGATGYLVQSILASLASSRQLASFFPESGRWHRDRVYGRKHLEAVFLEGHFSQSMRLLCAYSSYKKVSKSSEALSRFSAKADARPNFCPHFSLLYQITNQTFTERLTELTRYH